MADRFPFMRMYKNMADKLPSKDDQADFYKVLIEYALDDKEPDEESIGAAVFECARQVIDNWKIRQRNGSKGGRPKNQTETKPKPNDNQSITKLKPKQQIDELGYENQNQSKTKDKKYKSIKDKKDISLAKKEKVKQIFDLYNSICISLPRATKLTDQRASHISARLQDHSPDEIRAVFEKAERSEFLSGLKSSWRADFDWLINENNMVKVLEGRYDDRPSGEEAQVQHNVEAGRRAQEEAEARMEAEHKAEIEKLKKDHPDEWARIQEKSKNITSIKEVLQNEFS